MEDFKKSELQAFYTESDAIVNCMLNLVDFKDDDNVLEPCAGHGSFIEAILNRNSLVNIDAYEINHKECSYLQEEFCANKVNVYCCDSLLDENLLFKSDIGGYYDKIIANPPYGAWQDIEKRKKLKKIFNGLYVKESYTLFLFRCIDLLKTDGDLVFIIPDTFLNLHRHKGIREKILNDTYIKSIRLFPSKFFPGINFGYSNLSIIHLRKKNKLEIRENSIEVYNEYSTVEELVSTKTPSLYLPQDDILTTEDYSILISKNIKALNHISLSKKKLGDVAECVTGFYSGNDKEFLKVSSKEVPYSSKYGIIDPDTIILDLTEDQKKNGVDSECAYIPIVKGGNTEFYKSNNWFMKWTIESVKHYKNNKKSRYQNSNYYFKQGLAVPMVSSSKVTASILDNRLFDQSIVGVFSKEIEFVYYLLGFINSEVCNSMLRIINPTANNPANYMKKIPFIYSQYHFEEVNTLVKSMVIDKVIDDEVSKEKQEMLNSIFNEIFGM